MQYTLKNSVEIKGIGLHSGMQSILTIEPAEPNFGIKFLRVDIKDSLPIPALFSSVIDTRNCTCIGSSKENFVSTIEHIMSALYIIGIDNALIKVNNAEVPILDGSSQRFIEVLEKQELQSQNAPRKILKVKKEISFTDSNNNTIKLLPAEVLHVYFDIDFPSPVVGKQNFDNVITKDIYKKEIAPCRTFCEKYQVDYLQSIGLIKGGSLENAVVLDGNNVLNPEGFRVKNECVNHKVLDAIGDLYTSGYYIKAKVVANKTGHYNNNELLKVLFSSSENYEII